METRSARLILLLPAAIVLATAARIGAATPEADRHLLPVAVATPPEAVLEARRVHDHLAAVERELRARDVSHLSAAQRAARAGHLAALREYREGGVFPHNHDRPGERLPYFVDAHGTHCAMAYLIARSGGEALVARVANERNDARIAELADEPGLLDWLEAAGLSVEEAARIQPMYGYLPPIDEASRITPGYAVASALSGALSGAAIAVNVIDSGTDRKRGQGVFGLVAGVAGMGLGMAKIQDGGTAATVGAVNAGIGLTSAVLGTRTLLAAPADRAASDARAAPPQGLTARVSPIVDGGEGRSSAGFLLRLGF